MFMGVPLLAPWKVDMYIRRVSAAEYMPEHSIDVQNKQDSCRIRIAKCAICPSYAKSRMQDGPFVPRYITPTAISA